MLKTLVKAMVACVLLGGVAQARTVTVSGHGAGFDVAVQDALRQAVDQAFAGEAGRENARDGIARHAQGYVVRYAVLGDEDDGHGGREVRIEAEVNAGRIRDHAEALDILMAMADHPKVVLLGLDDAFESVSPVVPDYALLLDAVSGVFRDDFHFQVVDPGRPVPNKTRREALAAVRGMADDAILLRVVRPAEEDGMFLLTLEAVRLSDGKTLAVRSEEVFLPRYRRRLTAPIAGRLVFDALSAHAFAAGVGLAQDMVDMLQAERMPGEGTPYSLAFLDLPPFAADDLERALPGLPGFVRLQLDRKDARTLEFTFWSSLPGKALDREIRGLLDDREISHRSRVDGRTLRYKVAEPVFE